LEFSRQTKDETVGYPGVWIRPSNGDRQIWYESTFVNKGKMYHGLHVACPPLYGAHGKL